MIKRHVSRSLLGKVYETLSLLRKSTSGAPVRVGGKYRVLVRVGKESHLVYATHSLVDARDYAKNEMRSPAYDDAVRYVVTPLQKITMTRLRKYKRVDYSRMVFLNRRGLVVYVSIES